MCLVDEHTAPFWGVRLRTKIVHRFPGDSMKAHCGRTLTKIDLRSHDDEWDPEDPRTCKKCRQFYEFERAGLRRVEDKP